MRAHPTNFLARHVSKKGCTSGGAAVFFPRACILAHAAYNAPHHREGREMKTLIVGAIVAFVVGFALAFVMHGVWLADDYEAMRSIMRPEDQAGQYMPWMTVGYLVWAFGLAWLYSKGKENKPWIAQGIRFGLGIAAVSAVPYNFVNYAIQPWPLDLVMKGLLADVVAVVGACIAMAGVFNAMGEKRA
jgi:hypothetical protein